MIENALTPILQNQIAPMALTLDGVFAGLEKAAAQNVATATEGQEFTAIELRALVRTEMLALTQGLDYMSIITKGRVLDEIENEGLVTIHPGGYTTLEQLAQDQGISTSELSQILDMTRIIFPWIEINLGIGAAQIFSSVGKSNMRELVPVLKRLITGEPGRGSVENAVRRLIEDATATATAANQPNDQEAIRDGLIRHLLEQGELLTNRQLRTHVRPERTEPIDAVIIGANGHRFLIAIMNDAQEEMVAKRLHGYWEPTQITGTATLRPEPRVRNAMRALMARMELD